MATVALTFTAEELDLLVRAALNDASSWGNAATGFVLSGDPKGEAYLNHSRKIMAIYERLRDARAEAEARAVLERVEAK